MAQKKPQRPARLRHWHQSHAALGHRRRLTLWVRAEVLAAWRHQARTGQRAAPQTTTAPASLRLATVPEVDHHSLGGGAGRRALLQWWGGEWCGARG